MWHDSSIFVTQVYIMSRTWLQRAAYTFMCMYTCDMTHSYLWYRSTLLAARDCSVLHTYPCVWYVYVWHGSSTFVTQVYIMSRTWLQCAAYILRRPCLICPYPVVRCEMLCVLFVCVLFVCVCLNMLLPCGQVWNDVCVVCVCVDERVRVRVGVRVTLWSGVTCFVYCVRLWVWVWMCVCVCMCVCLCLCLCLCVLCRWLVVYCICVCVCACVCVFIHM